MSSKTERYIHKLLRELGEDPEREGLKKTPGRVARALAEITAGYHTDIDKLFNDAFFRVDYKEMVIVRDISFYSLCEHHMLPFFGKAHIAYIPNGKIVGLSKIPRLVEAFARRLQVQEKLTVQIADTLFKKLKPKGVGVVLEAQHLCMTMRGVKNASSFAATSSMLGVFQNDNRVREEFLGLIKKQVSGQ
ncbi:MAG: GTP cyclohydrolase I FolE [Elusimicrobia bacterium RIFOXYA12_FULL_51_18]|nr:MAG: GTP cyclohydrolase I FolE [Elusimicrobia bacterium RIFOXYA12_FULL_51_18]OGS28715.1 MAG: GTP cyclohydrolase I FolE [Elusimicrobia bacterium RIFOXYA2_FULL_53_38]